jgi:hypothetical protein
MQEGGTRSESCSRPSGIRGFGHTLLDLWWEDGFALRRGDGFVGAVRDALEA